MDDMKVSDEAVCERFGHEVGWTNRLRDAVAAIDQGDKDDPRKLARLMDVE